MLILLLFIGSLQAMALIAMTQLINLVATGVLENSLSSGFYWQIAGLLWVQLVLALCKWREALVAEQLGQHYVDELRKSAFAHVTLLDRDALSEQRNGSLLLRFVNDLTAIRNWISLGIARLLISGLMLGGTVIALFLLDTSVGLLWLIALLIALIGTSFFGPLLERRIRLLRRRRGAIAANLDEKMSGILEINAFAQRKGERRLVRKQSRKLMQAAIERASVFGLFRAFLTFVIGCTIVAALMLPVVMSPDLGAGALFAMVSLFALLSPNLLQLGRVYEYWKAAQIAREKLSQIYETGPVIAPVETPVPLPAAPLDIKIDELQLPGLSRPFSGRIASGDRIIVTGANGSGKTTLMHMLMRLVEPDRGYIKVNDVAVDQLRTGEWRRKISIFSSEFKLFRGTVASNIAFGNAKANALMVQRAAALCGMDAQNPQSPYYLERRIEESGSNLSAGEQMRIRLARALVGRPKILLCDEPESHLDADGLRLLRDILEHFRGAVIVASHSQQWNRWWTKKWELSGGQILSHAREQSK